MVIVPTAAGQEDGRDRCNFGKASHYQFRHEEGFRQIGLNGSSKTTTRNPASMYRRIKSQRQSVDPKLVQGTVASHAVNPVIGAQSTLVLLMNFQDDTSEPVTVAEIEDKIFNTSNADSLNSRLIELSYGKAWLAGDVMDWITLPIISADCSTFLRPRSSIFQNTVDFVDSLVDFSLYRRVIVIHNGANCTLGAIGSLGEFSIITNNEFIDVSLTIVNSLVSSGTLSHELGHNFGFNHQDGLECGEVSVGDFLDGCDSIDRGDPYDSMARSSGSHFSAGNKERIGWLEPQNIAELGTGFHEVAIHPLEVPTNQVQTIKIPVRYNLVGSSEGEFYYIEYRRPIGLDAIFSEFEDPAVGVLIHLQEKERFSGTVLLDMSPHVNSDFASQRADADEPHLILGQTFHDTKHDISITFDHVEGDTAIIQVNIPRICPNGTCDPGEDSCGCPEDCGPPANVDCTRNGIPDECESDCDNNGVADSCDLASGALQDCPGGIGNGVPDQCETFVDCNGNGLSDSCDITSGISTDLNANDIPDDCEPLVVVYVDVANCPNAGSGTSSNPYCRIQDAIDAQDVDAGIKGVVEIIVADGIYTGVGNKDIRFGGRALTLRSSNGPDNCIIDMEGVGRGFTFDNQEPLGARLEGFTITHGWGGLQGGGIFCDTYASPTIINCTITENSASNLGGGISIGKHARPSIINCRITNNELKTTTSTIYGAGVYCYGASPLIHNSFIADNVAVDTSSLAQGGGIHCTIDSQPTISDCVITRNTAKDGGGVSCVTDSSPIIVNTTISGNSLVSTYGDGGGIYVTDSNLIIRSCQITGNATADASNAWGGGFYFRDSNGIIYDTIIAGNSSGGKGGGIGWITSKGNFLEIDHCTITNNSAYWNGGGLTIQSGNASLTNSIVWSNTANQGNEMFLADWLDPLTMAVSYSDIEVGTTGVYKYGTVYLSWSPTNIDIDPQFVDPDGLDDIADTWLDNDYHLRNDSPCKSAGDPAYIAQLSSVDVDGEPRLMGCENEIGADELIGSVELWDIAQGRRDCNNNDMPDTCEIDLGLQEDCDGNSIIDQCELSFGGWFDCNANGIPDECEISNGTSLDVNGNCIPDECLQRPRPIAESTPVDKSRYIAFSPARAGCLSAIRVTLRSLYHPDVTFEGNPDFSAFEGGVRWVGSPAEFPEDVVGVTTFTAAQLQCEPYFGDWDGVDLVQVYGDGVLPSSLYEVQMVGNDCVDIDDTDCHSEPLQIVTGQWGDVTLPFYTPFGSSQPDIADVLAVVNKWLGVMEPRKAFSQLQPSVLNPDSSISISDILVVVDAWLGSPYPYSGPSSCP